jgi:hypothetical protein
MLSVAKWVIFWLSHTILQLRSKPQRSQLLLLLITLPKNLNYQQPGKNNLSKLTDKMHITKLARESKKYVFKIYGVVSSN